MKLMPQPPLNHLFPLLLFQIDFVSMLHWCWPKVGVTMMIFRYMSIFSKLCILAHCPEFYWTHFSHMDESSNTLMHFPVRSHFARMLSLTWQEDLLLGCSTSTAI